MYVFTFSFCSSHVFGLPRVPALFWSCLSVCVFPPCLVVSDCPASLRVMHGKADLKLSTCPFAGMFLWGDFLLGWSVSKEKVLSHSWVGGTSLSTCILSAQCRGHSVSTLFSVQDPALGWARCPPAWAPLLGPVLRWPSGILPGEEGRWPGWEERAFRSLPASGCRFSSSPVWSSMCSPASRASCHLPFLGLSVVLWNELVYIWFSLNAGFFLQIFIYFLIISCAVSNLPPVQWLLSFNFYKATV